MANQLRTVADIVADLQKLPQNLPVLVGCHYDNDDGLTYRVGVGVVNVEHSEAEFYYQTEPPDGFQAVTIC